MSNGLYVLNENKRKEGNYLTDYIKRMTGALAVTMSNSNLYDGKEGDLRLAREIGTCLRDSDEKEAQDYFDRSYIEVCVIGYRLKPPVDKREWDSEVLRKWKGSE